MAHETSSDEFVDLFDLPEKEGAPSMGVCGRSVSAPATFAYEKHDPAEQRKNITTIIDRSMVVNGIGLSTAYGTVISGVDDEQDGGEVRTAGQHLRNGQRMQIVRMADGSEFALPAAPLSHLPHPKDREDWSLLPTPVTANDPVDSSWIRQRTPIRNQSSQGDRYSSDDSFDRRFYPPNLNIFSPDEILVTEPERRSSDHPASDPGLSSPNIGEWYWNHRTQNTSESASHAQHDVTSNHEASTLPEDGERPWDIVHPDVGLVSDSPITPALVVDGQTNGTLADASDQNVLNRRLYITVPIYENSGNSAEQDDLPPVSDSQHESRVEPKTLDSATTGTNLDQSQAFAPGLINLSTSNKFSDARILLTSAFDCFPSQAYAVHRIMISRSSVLSAILERQTNLNTTILITAAKNFTVACGFEFALKRLYGLELLDRNGLYESARQCLESEGNHGDVPNQLDKTAMDLALCYGSAGTFLDCDDIVDAAFNLVLEILSWSNLETAFQFGLYPEVFLLACQKCRYRPKRKNENHNSDFNSADNSNNPKKGQNRRPFRGWRGKRALNKAIGADTHYADMAHSWTPKILSASVDFLIQNLPSNYHFDRTGLAKDLDDRITAQFRSEYSIANRNPVLASLAFGDHPLPTPECTRASAILLALPFERFREVIEGIRDRGLLTGDLIKTILQEREERHQTAVMKYTEQADPAELGPDVRSLGYGEFAIHVQILEYDADSGEEVIAHEYSLHREWRGFHGYSSGSIIRDFGGIR